MNQDETPNPSLESPPSGAALEIEKPAITQDPPERTLDEAALAASMQLFERAIGKPKANEQDDASDRDADEKEVEVEKVEKVEEREKPAEKPKPAKRAASRPTDKSEKPPEKVDEKAQPPAPAKGPKRAPTKPEVDPVEIAEAAARGVAEAMRSSGRDKPAEKPDKLEPEIKPEDLPEDYAEYFEALDLLPKIDPKYQGRNLKRELAEASRKEASYRKTWEKKNPGETFDPDAADHAEFYATIQPAIKPSDLRRADRELIRQRATEDAERRIEEKIGPDIQALRSQRAIQQIAPVVEQAQISITHSIAEGMGSDYANAMRESPEKFRSLIEQDPEIQEAAIQIGGIADAAIEQAAAFHAGVERPNMSNPSHARFFGFIDGLEEAAANGDIEPPEIKGRQFVTREAYLAMSPRQQARSWTIAHFEDFPKLLGAYAKTKIRTRIEENERRIEAIMKRRGYTKASVGTPSKPDKKTAEKAVEKPDDDDDQDQAPTVGARDSKRIKPISDDDPPVGVSKDLWNRAFRKVV